MSGLENIGALCKSYADAREDLENTVEEIRERRRKAAAPMMRGLRSRIAAASVARDALRDALEACPELFVKPRTRDFSGVKIGYRKRPGRFEAVNWGAVVDRVRERLPDRADELIRTRSEIVKPALKNVPVPELRKIGVSSVDAEDEVVIALASDDLDRLVDALMTDFDEGQA